MEREKATSVFLEFGLLLMVTGLFAVVLITSLFFFFSRESTITSSWTVATVGAATVSALFALVLFFLLRRLRRFMAYR